MFRAIALLIILSGSPQFSVIYNNNFLSEELLRVQNFQVVNQNASSLVLSAQSALAIDLDAQVSLYESHTKMRLPIASITKLITALVILEEHELDELVTISNSVQEIEGSRIWLYPGETITIENLIKGMLIASGNDAAYELAKHNAGSLTAFSKKMNRVAFYLGLKDSYFTNPAGFDDENTYSTVSDLSIVAKHILKYKFIREIITLKETVIYSYDGKLKHTLKNTNKLLDSFLQAKGLKTGTTEIAKECLITLVNINNNDVLIILLGSDDRYLDTKTIYNFLSENE